MAKQSQKAKAAKAKKSQANAAYYAAEKSYRQALAKAASPCQPNNKGCWEPKA